jgi:hypothetical protein
MTSLTSAVIQDRAGQSVCLVPNPHFCNPAASHQDIGLGLPRFPDNRSLAADGNKTSLKLSTEGADFPDFSLDFSFDLLIIGEV